MALDLPQSTTVAYNFIMYMAGFYIFMEWEDQKRPPFLEQYL